ncbi:DUF7503 family protein [Halorussus caseinilyticus]|nr:hypothetical protein [Halorussus sp. DT72]
MSEKSALRQWISNRPRAVTALWSLILLWTTVAPALASGGATSGP